MSEASNITYLPPENKIQYNTLYLAGQGSVQKGRENLVPFDIDEKCFIAGRRTMFARAGK